MMASWYRCYSLMVALAALQSGCASSTATTRPGRDPLVGARIRQISSYLGRHDPDTVVCFERELDGKPLLEGHVWARLEIQPTGEFSLKGFEGSTFQEDDRIRSCLAEVIRGWHLLPYPGRAVGMRDRFGWEPEAAIPPPVAQDPEHPEWKRVRGSMNMRVVRYVISAHLNELAACSALGTKIAVEFMILNNGRVHSAKVPNPTPATAVVEQCALDVFAKLRFPRPAGDGGIMVKWQL